MERHGDFSANFDHGLSSESPVCKELERLLVFKMPIRQTIQMRAMVFVSAYGNWKIKNKKWRFFVNTIAPWQMPVRHTLRNLQRCGAFIAAFTSEKHWVIIKKSLFGNWQLIPYISSIHLLILL
jgi:hypothetical protein